MFAGLGLKAMPPIQVSQSLDYFSTLVPSMYKFTICSL